MIGRAVEAFQQPVHRIVDLSIFLIAVQCALLWQPGAGDYPLQPLRIAAIGQAGDVEEALLVQRMAVPQRNLLGRAAGAFGFQAPVVGHVQQPGVEVGIGLLVIQQEQAHEAELVGGILFGNSFFFYLAVACAVALYWYLNKTRSGLYLRSVGESPATADAAGINVTRYKYLATVIGGGVSTIGGMVYIMTIAGGVWNHEGLSGVGWLAVALVIFCLWRPLGAIWGSVLFGALMILYLRLVIAFIPTQLYKILPYVVTVIVLIISSMRNNKEKQPPASLGLNYFREER